MEAPMIKGVNIEIYGCSGSGKTTILHIIGKALTDAGMHAKAIDDLGEVKEFKPTLPTPADDREISMATFTECNGVAGDKGDFS
jgi:adenylylsulfate kinase-like enzyme